MADTDQDQKTEQPTAKRLSDARKKGQVPTAPEMRHAVMFIAMMILMGGVGAWTLARLGSMFVLLWGNADDYSLAPTDAENLAIGVVMRFGIALAPMAAILFGLALLPLFINGLPALSWSRLAPQWSKLSPLSGFHRLFGMNALVEFGKTLAKFIAIAAISVIMIWPHAVALDQLAGAPPEAIAETTSELGFRLVKAVGILVILMAAGDYVYQRRAFIGRMRMTRQEVHDEYKQNDGDPKIKGRLRSIRMQRAKQRMMAAVPTASVVVTNPTHYAVALKYEHGEMIAPVVVAKGVDAVALRIREVAAEAGVPVIESPPLARALFATVEIDRPIPVEHYAAVAEIISFVLRLARQAR